MKAKSPRRANGEGFGGHQQDDTDAFIRIARSAQIPPIIATHWWRGELPVAFEIAA